MRKSQHAWCHHSKFAESHLLSLIFIHWIDTQLLSCHHFGDASCGCEAWHGCFPQRKPISDGGRPSLWTILLFYQDFSSQCVLPLPPNKRVANNLIVVHFHHYMYDTIMDMLRNSTVHPKQMMNFRDEKPVGFCYEWYRKPLCQTLHWAWASCGEGEGPFVQEFLHLAPGPYRCKLIDQ
jgi:hypothetical protein